MLDNCAGESIPFAFGGISCTDCDGPLGRRLTIRDDLRGSESESALRNVGVADNLGEDGSPGLPGSRGEVGFSSVPVTYLVKVANARKQNLAGVQKEKRTGRTCAVSKTKDVSVDQELCPYKTYGRILVSEPSSGHNVPLCLQALGKVSWPLPSQDI